MAQLNTRIALRHDDLSNWISANPILKDGEIGIVKLENKEIDIKIGNGLSTFVNLAYPFYRLSETSSADLILCGLSLLNSKVEDNYAKKSEISSGVILGSGTGIDVLSGKVSILQDDTDTSTVVIVGNPTIGSGVMTGITTSDYVYTRDAFNPSGNTWEIQMKVKTGSSFAALQCLISPVGGFSGIQLKFDSDGDACLTAYAQNGTPIFTTYSTVSAETDTDYIYNVSFDGSKYVVKQSLDNGTSWTQLIVKTISTVVVGAYPLAFGIYKGNLSETEARYPWLGSIDLGKSYIKVGGEYVWRFGKSANRVAKASSLLYGLVKPDNSTIIVDDGVISANLSAYATNASLPYRLVEAESGSVWVLENRSINFLDEGLSEAVTVSFPEQVLGKSRDFIVKVTTTETVYQILWPTGISYYSDDNTVFDALEANSTYMFSFSEIGNDQFMVCRKKLTQLS